MKHLLFKLFQKSTRRFLGRGLSNTWYGKLAGKIFRLIKPKYVDVKEGFRLYLFNQKDLISDYIAFSGEYEPFIAEVMKKNIKKGDVVVDIGSHIGYFTILMSKLVGEAGKVYAFEPEQKNFELLKKNIEFNKCSNVILNQIAITDYTGKIKLYLTNKSNSGTHSIHDSEGYTYEVQEVDCMTLDDYFKGAEKL